MYFYYTMSKLKFFRNWGNFFETFLVPKPLEDASILVYGFTY